ncbi:MAG TPA: hypothetical protein VNP92_22050, partial [Actinophytocola sp.]|nr:hypothetical protein [Actinophytocola sp.]
VSVPRRRQPRPVTGALVDAGAPLDGMQRAVDALGVEPVRLSVEWVSRQGGCDQGEGADRAQRCPPRLARRH